MATDNIDGLIENLVLKCLAFHWSQCLISTALAQYLGLIWTCSYGQPLPLLSHASFRLGTRRLPSDGTDFGRIICQPSLHSVHYLASQHIPKSASETVLSEPTWLKTVPERFMSTSLNYIRAVYLSV